MLKNLAGVKVVGIACFDSFGKLAMSQLSACREDGAITHLYLLDVPGRSISRRQRVEIQRLDSKTRITRYPWAKRNELLASFHQSCDVVILSLDGKRSRDTVLLLQSVWQRKTSRPLLITGYPGILFRHAIEGMLDRSYVDLLCLNSESDYKQYQSSAECLGVDTSNAVVTGLPILWNCESNSQATDRAPIIFFEQPSVPPSPLQRQFLCKELDLIAKRWPNRRVLFKPRTSSVETTLHKQHGEMARMLRKLGKKRKNLEVTYRPARQLLRNCSCAITVSSTAAIEAMAMGVSTRIVSDIGINETIGNHYFVGSGVIKSMHDIADDPFTVLHDMAWVEKNGFVREGKSSFLEAIRKRLSSDPSTRSLNTLELRGWGSSRWHVYALENGGIKTLSTNGVRSSNRKRNKTKDILRRVRSIVIGIPLIERLTRGR